MRIADGIQHALQPRKASGRLGQDNVTPPGKALSSIASALSLGVYCRSRCAAYPGAAQNTVMDR